MRLYGRLVQDAFINLYEIIYIRLDTISVWVRQLPY